jgi:hypothetical protein
MRFIREFFSEIAMWLVEDVIPPLIGLLFAGGGIVLVVGALVLASCGSTNVEYVKERACAKWEAQGYECVDYEGYQWSPGVFSYGRGDVSHRLKRVPDNGIRYSGKIERWGDELHVYGPTPNDGEVLSHHESK